MGFFVSFLISAALFVLSDILKPKPELENARPASLGDFRFPTATEGRIVPLIWGTVKLEAPNVVWYGDLTQTPLTQKVKTGLFSSRRQTIGFQYNLGVQMALCRGEIDELLRIWVGEDILWDTGLDTFVDGFASIAIDESEFLGGQNLGNGGLIGDIDFYTGNEVQAASSYLNANGQSISGDTPAYRGTSYVVLHNDDDGFYLGNSSSIKRWSFELRRIPNGLNLSAAQAALNTGNDANPINVIYEIMTDTDWGLSYPVSDIDVPDFTAAAAVLATEGNGFSFVLDTARNAEKLIEELERQISGIVFVDQSTGKWRINLARRDYVIGNIPQINEDDISDVRDFSRGAYEDTINAVRIGFSDRGREYFDTFALAQDMANVRIQGNVNVATTEQYPGVKDANLANNIAWRELRTLSYPLAKATLIVDRKFSDLNLGDVIAFTSEILEVNQLPMRVTEIDYGTPTSNQIRLALVEDIFAESDPSFAAPQQTGWVRPQQDVINIPNDNRVVIEAPRALIERDTENNTLFSRIWVGALNQNDGAVGFDIDVSTATSAPGLGTFLNDGQTNAFMETGTLSAAVTQAFSQDSMGILTLNVASSSEAARIAGLFTEPTSTTDIGENLTNLFMVNDEMMACQSVAAVGTTVVMTGVVRGMLDTTPSAHASGDNVFLMFAGGTLTESGIFDDAFVRVRLLPFNLSGTLAAASATSQDFQLDNRDKSPYAPIRGQINSTLYATSANIDTQHSGTGDDEIGLDVDFRRRNFRRFNQTEWLAEDAGTTDTSFPSADSTVYRVMIYDNPSGSNTLIHTTDYNSGGASVFVRRADILAGNSGSVPGTIRVAIEARHLFEGTLYTSYQTMNMDATVTSAFSSQTNLGALNNNDVSATYVAPAAGTYNFLLRSSVLSSGEVQARLNGGAWATVISSGNTTGTLTGVTATDDIEVRHTQATVTSAATLEITPPSGSGAYGILI